MSNTSENTASVAPVQVDASDAPTASFTKSSGLVKGAKTARKTDTGTRIRFWADTQIFTPGAAFDLDEIHSRARQTSYLVPGLRLVVSDERSGQATDATTSHQHGIIVICTHVVSSGPN